MLRPKLPAAFAVAALVAAGAAYAQSNPLAGYAGKYPFDGIAGVAFLDQEIVITAVTRTVTDSAVRGWVLKDDVTAGPIVVVRDTLRTWACEPHNCGDHHWAIVLDLTSNTADVCYFDATAMKAGQSRWYLASGKNELRQGDCPQA